ncbi:hypothetical protein KSP40_PGU021565 [Platanthera guangdongensis]|uniref:Uncharacterized protein n=1 Tax=Platanthera guangdongensis TaxID=2320717 RepID=A0ABR2MNI9_9ASPA
MDFCCSFLSLLLSSNMQLLNYRLLGIKLSESPPHHAYVEAVLSKVMLDIFLSSILDGILKRAKDKKANETELDALQPIVMKLLQNFSSIENAFASDMLQPSALQRVYSSMVRMSHSWPDSV